MSFENLVREAIEEIPAEKRLIENLFRFGYVEYENPAMLETALCRYCDVHEDNGTVCFVTSPYAEGEFAVVIGSQKAKVWRWD